MIQLDRTLSLLLALVLSLTLGTAAQAQTPTTTVENGSGAVGLQTFHNGALLAPGTLVTDGTENDSIPATGAGTRLMWYPAKAAFRAGRVGDDKDGTQWDAAKVGDYSAAFGVDTKASGPRATAVGDGTTAATPNSLSLGECNSTNQSDDGTLLAVGTGSYNFSNANCGSTEDAFTVDKSGNLAIDGVFTDDPSTYAGHLRKSESGSSKSGHAVLVENAGGSNSDGLAVQTGADDSPGDVDNFVTFYDGDGSGVGSIEGNGSGGIDYTSGGADFAEELPVAQDAEPPAPAEIVGVRGGTASLDTDGAYFLRLQANGQTKTRRLTVVK
jgi:hypothetical protein